MSQESIVLDVHVAHGDEVHTASYFVEHGVIHARIGDRILLRPLLGGDAAEVVRGLLQEHLAHSLRLIGSAGISQATL